MKLILTHNYVQKTAQSQISAQEPNAPQEPNIQLPNVPGYQEIDDNRKPGKTLKELGHKDQFGPVRKVAILRAAHPSVKQFNYMDYITLSKRFAKEHADHQAAVEEEPYHVLYAYVPTEDVREAYNPGEYFYAPESKQPAPARVIYRAKVEQ
jgi:hypothetical protein